MRPEKQVIKLIITSEAKGISQTKVRLGQGRAGIKVKFLKFLWPQHFYKPEQPQLLPCRKSIIQIAERPIL